MAKLTAPYNFVPLNQNIYIPAWWKYVSQDIPLQDSEDGYIELNLHNITPLCVCDGRDRNDSKSTNQILESAHVNVLDGKKLYFIPATSIKGMLRSTLEVLSFAKMAQYNNDFFGYREIGKQYAQGDYVKKMQNSKAGWLKKDGDKYYLYPCKFDIISHDSIKSSHPKFNKKGDAQQKYESIGKNYFPTPNENKTLVCTGYMNNKKHEYYFYKAETHCKELSDKDANRFLSVHKPTPLFEKFYLPKLKNGIAIPVFYLEERGETKLGLSKLFRYPYKYGVKNLVKQTETDGYDLCEILFGFINGESKGALKGRVQIGNAFADKPVQYSTNLVKGVLGQPSASYYPLYISQRNVNYNNYDSGVSIAGRKFYRVRSSNGNVNLPSGNGNENVLTTFNPAPSDLNFRLKIYVHNLKSAEIGALLSALTFHNTSNVHHNIGLAKGYGYGKLKEIKLQDISLKGLKLQPEEYLFAFEQELNAFVYENEKKHWIETEQVTTLLGIHSGHDSESLKIMELDQYLDNKKNSNFNVMQETHISPVSVMGKYEEEIIEETYLMVDNGVKCEKLNENDCLYFIKQCKELKLFISSTTNPRTYSNKMESLNGIIKSLEKRIEELKEEEEKRKKEEGEAMLQAEIAARQVQRLEAGLSFLVETKVNSNELKISELSKGVSRINNFLQKNVDYKISDKDKDVLLKWLKKLPLPTKKADKNEYENIDSKSWICLKEVFGEDTTTRWYHELSRK